MNNSEMIRKMYAEIGNDVQILKNPNIAHFIINYNKVLSLHPVSGLNVKVDELDEGIKASITVDKGVKIENPVHICFGMIRKSGVQNIILDINIDDNAEAAILAHCVFPTGSEVIHNMDARIRIGKGACYTYLEKHVHGDRGEVKVYPKAVVNVEENGHFTTEFNLIKGRAGLVDIDIEAFCGKNSVVQMYARIAGKETDNIVIKETGRLEEGARGVIKTNIAVKDKAESRVFNTLRAVGANARGHVDCKEIVLGEAKASAVPIVEVLHPKAHVTHEAAIGSIDKKQLETLMARGLSEEKASDVIIKGLLS